jgi:cation-transporting P-type ATPase 13A2
VARDCGILTPNQCVISINCNNNYPPELFFSLTTKNKYGMQDFSLMSNSNSIASLDTIESQTITNNTLTPPSVRPQTLCNNYKFALTGKVWRVIREFYPDLIAKVVTRGSVFARMSPDQKQQLVQELQSLGYYVGECWINSLPLQCFSMVCFDF